MKKQGKKKQGKRKKNKGCGAVMETRRKSTLFV